MFLAIKNFAEINFIFIFYDSNTFSTDKMRYLYVAHWKRRVILKKIAYLTFIQMPNRLYFLHGSICLQTENLSIKIDLTGLHFLN